jgi:N-methylhydantoinase B
VLELNYPLRVKRYAVRWGSGGNGRNNGGDGVVRQYEFMANADVSLLTERRSRPPWGLEGGNAGQSGFNRLDDRKLPAKTRFNAVEGQLLTIETPGGGGFGSATDPSGFSSG